MGWKSVCCHLTLPLSLAAFILDDLRLHLSANLQEMTPLFDYCLTTVLSQLVVKSPDMIKYWTLLSRVHMHCPSYNRQLNNFPLPFPASYIHSLSDFFFGFSHMRRGAAPLAGGFFSSSGILFVWVWTNSAIVTNKAAWRRWAHASRHGSALLMVGG